MNTSTPQPQSAGARPGVPLPGQHLRASADQEPADPAAIDAEVTTLLTEFAAVAARDSDDDAAVGVAISRQGQILTQAHEVLVRALATVDKI